MKRPAKIILFLLPAFFLLSAAASAQVNIPEPVGHVNDYAGIIRPDARRALEGYAAELESKTTAELAVVTLQTTSPVSIEEYAVTLFERWGIGKKGKDNGALLLVALRDRRVRIETGYGLEGALPDAVCDRVIQEYMIPYFKEGKYSEGILAGGMAVIGLVAKEYGVELEGFGQAFSDAAPQKPTLLASILNFVFTLFIFALLVSLRMGLFGWFFLMGSGRRRGGRWYGGGYGGNSGGFSGGFGGFGGGFSGGGGASGGW